MAKKTKGKSTDRNAFELYHVSRYPHLTPVHPLKDRPLVFTHIPKTAGTTLDRIFHALDVRCGLRRRRIMGTIYNQFLGEGKEDNTLAGEDFTSADFDAVSFVAGHVPFGFSRLVRSPCLNATILREPISRSRSHFLFGVSRKGWSLTTEPAEVFAAGHITDNSQVRQIAGCTDPRETCDAAMLQTAIENIDSQFDFVGISERFDDFLRAIISAMDLPDIVYDRGSVGTAYPPKVTRKLSSKLEPFNEFDKLLYQHVADKSTPFRDGLMTVAGNSQVAANVIITHPLIEIGGREFPMLSPQEFLTLGPELKKIGVTLNLMDYTKDQ